MATTLDSDTRVDAGEARKVSEDLFALQERATQLFAGLKDLPEHGSQWEAHYAKAFEIYTKLWRFQQVHRTVLEDKKEGYGMVRWEIGELACRIGELYFHYYLRTSDVNYLHEAYVFLEAVKSRGYFKGVAHMKSLPVMALKLRYCVRFIVVALLLNRTTTVRELVHSFTRQVNAYTAFKPPDVSEWQAALQEVTLFLQADNIPLLTAAPDSPLSALRSVRRTRATLLSVAPGMGMDLGLGLGMSESSSDLRTLRSAVLVTNRAKQVKFSELSLDMYRVMLALEPVHVHAAATNTTPTTPTTNSANASPNSTAKSVAPTPSTNAQSHSQSQSHSHSHQAVLTVKQLAEPARKLLLYRPTVPECLAHVAQALQPLGDGDVLMLYVSADAGGRSLAGTLSTLSAPSTSSTPYSEGGVALRPRDLAAKARHVASSQSGPDSDVLYPEDLAPLLRAPSLVVIDSENSAAFARLSSPFRVPCLVLCSPQTQPQQLPESSAFGSLLTLFLTSPLDAFCHVSQRTELERPLYERCAALLDAHTLTLLGTLASHATLSHEVKALCAVPLVRLLVARFLWCSAVLQLHVDFQSGPPAKMLPLSSPTFSSELTLHPESLRLVELLATELGVMRLFKLPNSSSNNPNSNSLNNPNSSSTSASSTPASPQ